MNRSDIVRAVSFREGITIKQAERYIDAFLETVGLSMACGEDVNIRNFGKFEVRARKPVVRFNPRTGDKIEVPAKNSVAFKAAPNLKTRVNGG